MVFWIRAVRAGKAVTPTFANNYILHDYSIPVLEAQVPIYMVFWIQAMRTGKVVTPTFAIAIIFLAS
jgi:hypothetical protein